MQPLSGNQRPDLLTSLMNFSLVLRLPREMHLSRSSSNAPRLPSFLKLLQYPHVLLTFDKVHNPLRLPRKTKSERPKVLRTPQFFALLTSKCASRHNGVHFFHIATSKSAPKLKCFVHFDFEMCFATAAAQPAVCAYRPPFRTALCSSGGRGACAATSVLAALLFLRRGALAGRRGRSIFFWKKSVVRYHYKIFICVHSCKDTLSFSYRSLSLFIICRSVCSRIISHTFSGIVWRWGLRGWELGTSQSLAKWNGHYILRFISWCTVSVFGVSRGCKDRAFNTYNGSCQIGLSNAKS